MKRYWLFSGDDYYAHGGVADLVTSSDSLPDLLARGRAISEDDRWDQWWHIFDAVEGKIVAGDVSGYGQDPDLLSRTWT